MVSQCLLFVSLFSSIALTTRGEQASQWDQQSPYLKEIIQGRCYDQPPTGSANDCPEMVESITNALEGLDCDMNGASFASYMEQADFSSPPNKALMWLGHSTSLQSLGFKFFRSANEAPFGMVTPERTPGGTMMSNLALCGVAGDGGTGKSYCDEGYDDCDAFSYFWDSAYETFASLVSGTVYLVIEPDRIDIRSTLAQLNASVVTKVVMYAENCRVTDIQSLIEYNLPHIDNVVCLDDPIEFTNLMVCTNDQSTAQCTGYHKLSHDNTDDDSAIPEEEEEFHMGIRFKFFFWFLFFGLVYYFCTPHHGINYDERKSAGYINLPQNIPAPTEATFSSK